MGLLGNFSRPAIPALFHTVKTDEEINVRIVATDALSQIRVEPQLVVPLLEIPLSDADFAVRCAAVRALETFGADAQQAVPALVPMLSDSDEDVRLDATNALKAIDPEAAAKAGVK